MRTLKKPSAVLLFNNLTIAFFDSAGRQVPELQKGVVTLLAEEAERAGYDLDGVLVETQSEGNWRIVRDPKTGWRREPC